ncbi:PREDICTED: uncharacterized protein LOC100631954, partial [Amphimedon queenslandica]|uniref:Integrase catalytic domain-containing protein n=1 Tax=Amphimedon queenslandica TaxID=400682 RepID=A0AAN0IP20_AMPQE
MESLKSPLSKVKDRFTRWPEAFPLRDISALTIARALVASWISRFGVPSTVTTDRGSQFESSVFAQLTRLLGTRTYPAELVYATTVRFPGEFFSPTNSLSLSKFSDYVAQLNCDMRSLSLTPKPLQHPYDGPYKVLERTEKYDVIDINGTRDTISIRCLKSAHTDKISSIILPNHDSLLTNTPHSHSTSSSTPLTTDSFKANTTHLETDSTCLDTDTNCSKTNGTHLDTRSSQRVRFPKLLNTFTCSLEGEYCR